jgi:RimJ/RimL family protein N-acetyltransferase
MNAHTKYIFISERLGFRTWANDDLDFMSKINVDEEVMRYFPSTVDRSTTELFVTRMQQMYMNNGYCYFAVDRLDTGQFIGFIGLSDQTYDASFTPCVDIGWRLGRSAWGQGFATEGALRGLDYGHHDLSILRIVAVAPMINLPSIRVMQKIGMQQVMTFNHPVLHDYERLVQCEVYQSQI